MPFHSVPNPGRLITASTIKKPIKTNLNILHAGVLLKFGKDQIIKKVRTFK